MGGMEILLILGVVVCAGLVLFALARGLYHFSQGHRATTEGPIHDTQVMQNRMMIARSKWLAITIILLVRIGVLAAACSSTGVPRRDRVVMTSPDHRSIRI